MPVQFSVTDPKGQEHPSTLENGSHPEQTNKIVPEEQVNESTNQERVEETTTGAASENQHENGPSKEERPLSSSGTVTSGQMPIQPIYSMHSRPPPPMQNFNHRYPGPPRQGFPGHPVSARPGMMHQQHYMHRPGPRLPPMPRNDYMGRGESL